MFVGHLALAFAAKRAAPAVSLGWLMAAVTALDLLWPLFLLAGIEHVRVQPGATAFTPLVFVAYPWSHSLLTAAGWGAPDMPLWPSDASPRFGLALWRSIPATFVVEGALWIAGLALYLRGRHAVGRTGPIALWSFVALCTVMWITGPWSPPPPDARTLAWFALIGWIVLPWTALADRSYR